MAPSVWQIIILVVIVAVLFSGKKMRNFGADLGTSIKGFKKAIKDDSTKSIENKDKEDDIIEGVTSTDEANEKDTNKNS